MSKTKRGWTLNEQCPAEGCMIDISILEGKGLSVVQHCCVTHKYRWTNSHPTYELYEIETGEISVREKAVQVQPSPRFFIDGPLMGREVPPQHASKRGIVIPALDQVVKYPPDSEYPNGCNGIGSHTYLRRDDGNFYYQSSTGEPTDNSPCFGWFMPVKWEQSGELTFQSDCPCPTPPTTFVGPDCSKELKACSVGFKPIPTPPVEMNYARLSKEMRSGVGGTNDCPAEGIPTTWLNGLPVHVTKRLPGEMGSGPSGGILSTWQPEASASGGFAISSVQQPKPLVIIGEDGKVTLRDNIDLEQVKTLPRPYLLLLREVVNTAIFDMERAK